MLSIIWRKTMNKKKETETVLANCEECARVYRTKIFAGNYKKKCPNCYSKHLNSIKRKSYAKTKMGIEEGVDPYILQHRKEVAKLRKQGYYKKGKVA